MNNNNYEKQEFVIREKVLSLDSYIRKYIVNIIPRINRDIRIHLLDELYNLVKNLHYAIYNKGNIRIKYLTDIIINISLIDYLLGIINKYDVNDLYMRNTLKKLLDIKNMINKWKLTEESKKNENK